MAIIIKGNSISGGKSSRDHYLRGKENSQITVLGVRGFATKSAEDALEMTELSAKGTKCKRPIYSAKLSPETDRIWTRDEAIKAALKLEKNLGLTGNPLILVEHIKHGRTHYHALWDRRPLGGGAARNMSNNYAIHLRTQRELEQEMGLKPMMAKGRDFKKWEIDTAKRHECNIFELRDAITESYRVTRTGEGFKTFLAGHDVILCRGDKCQFVLILPWGQHKALSSMILGRPRKAEIAKRFADIDMTRLPTVMEAKAKVKAALQVASPLKNLPDNGMYHKGIEHPSLPSLPSVLPAPYEYANESHRLEMAPVQWRDQPFDLPRIILSDTPGDSGAGSYGLSNEIAMICHGIDMDYASRIAAAKATKDYGLVKQLEEEREQAKRAVRQRMAKPYHFKLMEAPK